MTGGLGRAGIGGMHGFVVVWVGQLVSLVGSATSGFALGIWVLSETGSVTSFAASLVCGYLPGIVIAPFAGVLVDRWPRRAVLLGADLIVGFAMGLVGLAYLLDDVTIAHVLVFQAIASFCAAFQWPAFAAALPQLVPRRHLGRANAMVNLGQATAELLAPLIGGVLLAALSLGGVIALDLISFCVALVTLSLVRIAPTAVPAERSPRPAFGREIWEGWTHISARRGLLGLLVFFAVCNFLVGAVTVLVAPLVLATASVAVLGMIASIGGAGMVAGGLVMSVWGGPARRIPVILGAETVGGVMLVVGGAWPQVAILAVASFGFFCCLPLINANSQTIWQTKVPPELHGRVFATRRMIAQSFVPLSYVVFSFLAEWFAGWVPASGTLFGAGPGRGPALLLSCVGVALIVVTGLAFTNPRIRAVESELPDQLPSDDQAAGRRDAVPVAGDHAGD